MRLALFSFLLMPFATNAADLLVAPGGSGAVYPTINAAIAAAAQGDRLVIQPAQYNENVIITKSLELVSNVPGQRYTVNGDIVFAPATTGRSATVLDALVLDSIKTGSITGTGHTWNVIACKAKDVYCLTNLYGDIAMRLLSDSITGSVQLFPPADVIGCHIAGIVPPPYNAPLLISPHPFISSTKRSRVIGNVIGTEPSSPYWLLGLSTFTPFDVQNNFFVINNPAIAIQVIRVPNSFSPGFNTSAPCSIVNNSIRVTGSTTLTGISVEENDPTFNVDIRNNFLAGPCTVNCSAPAATIDYNTLSVSVGNMALANGAPIAGSPAINAGDPGAEYTDLDLSRNDAGCYGGSFSRDNFDDPLPTTAIVGIVNAPRRTQAALSVPITADGFDR